MRLIILILFIQLNTWYYPRAIAQPLIEIYSNEKILDISNKVKIWQDDTHKATIKDVSSADWADKFKAAPSPFVSLGYTSASVWLKFQISNPTHEPCLLEIASPHLDSLILYMPDNEQQYLEEGYLARYSGDAIPDVVRDVSGNRFVFEIPYYAGVKTFYLRVRSVGAVSLPLSLGNAEAFAPLNRSRNLVEGAYYGIMVAMFCYNIFIFLTLKDSVYLIYALHVLSLFAVGLDLNGCIGTFLYGYSKNVYSSVITQLGGITGAWFGMQFLNARQFAYGGYLFLRGYIVWSFVLMLFTFAGFFAWVIPLTQITVLAGLVSAAVIGYMVYREGYTPARFYIIAWLAFALSLLLFILQINGILPYGDFTQYIVQLGSGLEMVLFAFALADRISIYRKEREEAREKMLQSMMEQEQLIASQKRDLEDKVRERTRQLEKNNRAIRQKNAELSELNQLKDKLFSIIAHDFRSPLNSIRGVVTLAKNDLLSPDDIKRMIIGIDEKLLYTAELIDHLLLWAETQMKGIDVQPTTISIYDVTESNIKLLEPIAQPKQITLCNEVPHDTQAFADLNMVKLIVRNLISNAIKFTHKQGKITVSAMFAAKNLRVAISDTGVGISPENQQRLFKILDTPVGIGTANEKGIGLGLIMCKEFVERNGGRIWVESAEGLGSTFYFTLPLPSDMPMSNGSSTPDVVTRVKYQ